MIVRESKVPAPPCADPSWGIKENPLFLDIETTGLGWRSSHLYLIGLLFRKQSEWRLRQYFLKHPFAEKEMLQEISAFLEEAAFSQTIHFNGDTFDLPYLRQKYAYYALPIPTVLSAQNSLDLLRILRPYKQQLGLSSLRQKEIEQFLSLSREDRYDGGELIRFYQNYLETGAEEMQALLFLHNREDVQGLTRILPMLAYPALWQGRFTVKQVDQQESEWILRLTPELSLPMSLSYTAKNYRMEIDKTEVRLVVPVFAGVRKRFFSNYTDYYYLPQEDEAIHKSVARYVDRKYREPARASTCYQKVTGTFLPRPVSSTLPAFYADYRSDPAWMQVDAAWAGDLDHVTRYARGLLQELS